MTGAAIEAICRCYIGCLNERRVNDLGEFVHETLTYNGKSMTRLDYQKLITGDIAAIPDLFFDIRVIVADDDRIAYRLGFKCTPQREFLEL